MQRYTGDDLSKQNGSSQEETEKEDGQLVDGELHTVEGGVTALHFLLRSSKSQFWFLSVVRILHYKNDIYTKL